MLPVLVAPPPPVKPMTFATAGSLLDRILRDLQRLIHHGEGSVLRPLHAPAKRPRILLREKSLRDFDGERATFNAIVSTSTLKMSTGLPSAQCRLLRYRPSTQSNNRSLIVYKRPCFTPCSLFNRYAHMVGVVVVSEITIETRIAGRERNRQTRRNNRPTIPPISSSGIKTAISEMLIDSTVNPISLAPRSVAAIGAHTFLEMPRDVLHHHDRVIHDEPCRNRQRHQRQVVQRIALTRTSRRTFRSARPAPRPQGSAWLGRYGGRRRRPESPARWRSAT